ncbi:MAG: hypothetical protein KDC80_04195 [Saprospiraceae bacterium]|nr:hypothetical protein [Saprospiraceae bacterium]
MKNIIIIAVAFFSMIAQNISAKVNVEALDYTYCNWQSYWEYPKKHTFYHGEDIYVRVKPQKHYDIKYMDLYVNNVFIRRESSYPYEWCRPGGGDNYLRNLSPGNYKLKCKIYDKCGGCHWIYYDICVTGNGGGNNNYCNWNSWFKCPQNNQHFPYGKDVYVRVDCQKYQDIEWMALYLDNHFIRKETQYPYEWCKGSGNSDYRLRNMKKGCYKLKVRIKDKCGQYHEKYSTFYVN